MLHPLQFPKYHFERKIHMENYRHYTEKIQSYEHNIEQGKELINKLSNDLPQIRNSLEK